MDIPVVNIINAKYAEMDKYIGNLESDIQSIQEFEREIDFTSRIAGWHDTFCSLILSETKFS